MLRFLFICLLLSGCTVIYNDVSGDNSKASGTIQKDTDVSTDAEVDGIPSL